MIQIPTTLFDGNTAALDELDDPTPFRFYAAQEGWLVDKKTLFGRFIVPTDKNPFAPQPEWAAKAYWDVPPLSAELLGRAWGFFRAAWEQRKSEAMVYLLHLNGNYELHVPKQRASAGGVHARLDPAELPMGATIVGSLHSHCNFNAFHSGTDQADARKNDGLHLTVGHVDQDPAEWAVMLSYSGFLWDLEMHHVTETMEGLAPITPPAEWLARIDEPVKWTQPTSHQHGLSRGAWTGRQYNPVLFDDADDTFWEAYWKARGHTPHQSDPEPIETAASFIDLDTLIRSGRLGQISEPEIDDLQYAQDALADWADHLMDGYGIAVDMEFSALWTGDITEEKK